VGACFGFKVAVADVPGQQPEAIGILTATVRIAFKLELVFACRLNDECAYEREHEKGAEH